MGAHSEEPDPDHLDMLCRKHAIEPFDAEPWIKGFTAGSDDHGGIFIGQTYTEAAVRHGQDFYEALKGKKTAAGGRHSTIALLSF